MFVEAADHIVNIDHIIYLERAINGDAEITTIHMSDGSTIAAGTETTRQLWEFFRVKVETFALKPPSEQERPGG